MVQSICLTSRGSLVRIRLPPPRSAEVQATTDRPIPGSDVLSYFRSPFGTLAQLVQSACFTRMRSLVRIQYVPPKPRDHASGLLHDAWRPLLPPKGRTLLARCSDHKASATTKTLPVINTRSAPSAAATAASRASFTEAWTFPLRPRSVASPYKVPTSKPRGISALQK